MSINQEIIDPPAEQPSSDGTATSPNGAGSPLPKKKSLLVRIIWSSLAILAVLAAAVWYLLQSAQRVPEFYSEVLKTDMVKAHEDGQEFERNLVRLQNTAVRRHPWLVEITQDQVNGWFATDLLQKFPESLPANIENPRAVFTEDEILLAFQYTVKGITGIVVISAEVFCTDKPNEIAVQVNEVKTGIIPLPVGPWLERVADSIRNAGIPVFWSKTSDTPLAIFTLPEHITTNATKRVEVEAIDLQPGRLVIAGKSMRQSHSEPSKQKNDQRKPAKAKQQPRPDNKAQSL